MDKLEACPFCGGGAEVSYYTSAQSSEPKGYFVECVSCAAAGPSVEIQGQMPDRVEHTQAKAATMWNARAALSAIPDERAAIVAWLRNAMYEGSLADDIERGDHLKDSHPTPDAV